LIILLPGGDMSAKLIPDYEQSLKKHGIKNRRYYPSTDAEVDDPKVLFRNTSGIIFGGGSSICYYRRYAAGAMKRLISTAYEKGVPVMACCGSVMMVGDIYPIYQEGQGEAIECRPALGLVSGCVFGVHFDKDKSVGHLIDNMRRAGIAEGLGLGVRSWAVLKDGKMVKTVGDIHKVKMTDSRLGEYEVVKAPLDG
jgi:cyanophycinase-like exopeptidase